jgi:RNA polymerase sigma factor (sigma-70 family)
MDATLPTTRVTLLTQLRQDPSDQAGWDEFVERYGRHIYRWCRQWKLQDADAEDVTQDILVKLTQKLRAFAYDPSRSFHGWLKTVAHHAWRDIDDSRRHARRAAGDSQVQELRNPASATAAPWSWRRISSVSSATSPSGRDPSKRRRNCGAGCAATRRRRDSSPPACLRLWWH